MDRDVTLWQRGVQDDQPELGVACYLFEASTAAFSALLSVLSASPAESDSASYVVLRNEFRKFYMWNEGFATRSGGLDQGLSGSKNLKATVLKLMVQWAKALCRVPSVLQDHDWSPARPKLVDLEVLADKASQVAQAAAVEIRSQYAVIDISIEPDSESYSDNDSDTSSFGSDVTFDDVVEDLQIYMENLNNLSSSLEYPATDFMQIEDSKTVAPEDLSSMPEHVRPFFRIIRDRFPSIETALVKKLGEANWQRRERLREQLASMLTIDSVDSSSDDNSSVADTIRDPNRQAASNHRSSTDFSITHQSITTGSDFSEPSLFDRSSLVFPNRRFSGVAESITSFATSVASGPDHGQRSIPKLPENHDFEAPFQCQICGEILRNVRNRADWKKHVYDDLQPYICLFTDCNLGLQTYKSRREWIDHEFQVHRVNSQWCCNLCKEVFRTQEIFRAHIEDVHENKFNITQIEEFIAASKRFVSRDGRAEECPFCLTVASQTQKSFASHVGRHLQEISLAALPLLNSSSDDEDDENDSESEEDNDGDDCDDCDIGDNGDNECKKEQVEAADLEPIKGELNQQNSGGDPLPVMVGEAREVPSSVDGSVDRKDDVRPSIESELETSLSSIRKSVPSLLTRTKQLLETLTKWSQHQATEMDVSDVYVRFGFDFNTVCRDFAVRDVDISDLGNVPELLRPILESTLSQEASVENLDRYLPSIRDIIITLLHSLKRKNKELGQKKLVQEEEQQFQKRGLGPEEKTPVLLPVSESGDPAEKTSSISTNRALEPLPNREIVRAVWDFEARHPDEISLKKGDLVKLIEKDHEYQDGWYLGQHQGSRKYGLFPAVRAERESVSASVSQTGGFKLVREPQVEKSSSIIPDRSTIYPAKRHSPTIVEPEPISELKDKPPEYQAVAERRAISGPPGISGKIKLVVVGDESLLQTNLLISYTTNKFPSEYTPTVFNNYAVTVMVEEKPYILCLFDIAGHQDLDLLRPLAYPLTDVFLICASIGKRVQYENAREKWAPELRRHCPGVPIFLVGVKQPPDDDDKDALKKVTTLGEDLEYGRNVAKDIGAVMYLECDLLTQRGLKEVFDQAITAAINPPRQTKKQSRWRQAFFAKADRD